MYDRQGRRRIAATECDAVPHQMGGHSARGRVDRRLHQSADRRNQSAHPKRRFRRSRRARSGADHRADGRPFVQRELGVAGYAVCRHRDGRTRSDALDTEFSQAPETTANIGFQHTARLDGGGTFTTRLDYSYSDQFWRSQIPNFRTEYYGLPPGLDEGGDYGVVNARLTYAPSAVWEVSVFGTNLTNEYYLNSGFFHSLWDIDFATVGRPREAGVSLKVLFD
jgi:outer membrane receptor protein involved in Fe transport